ncbi:MAG: hypothetical protein LBU06_00295, partial [Desulfovibrio sp.]|nr:hypothetical protein [Desulfovibrio sp.]
MPPPLPGRADADMDYSGHGSLPASGGGKNFSADRALGRTRAEHEIVSTWPPAWREIFAKTIRAPLLWTYLELGRDLTGQGNPGRAKFLRDLISRLDLPRGSSAFWPVCLDSDAGAAPDGTAAISRADREIFYQGVQILRPLMVIFFGAECADSAVPELENPGPFSFQFRNGALHVFFPPLERLLANSAAADLCADFLQHILSEF